MGGTRSGRSTGSKRSLFVPVSPSLLSQIRLETPQGKRAGHILHSGELIPEMNVFLSTEAGCPPLAPVCQPQLPPRLPHLLDAERGFPQRAPTWPHFPGARRYIFRGSHLLRTASPTSPGRGHRERSRRQREVPLPPPPPPPRGRGLSTE